MVRWGGLGSSPGRGHCVVFLGKTLYSHIASLHPGVQMGISKYAGGNTPSRFMLRKPELSTGPMCHLSPHKGLLYFYLLVHVCSH